MPQEQNNITTERHDSLYWKTVAITLCGIALLFLLIGLALSSCNTPKRLSKIHVRKPVMVADSCAVWFPVKSDTVTYVAIKDGRIDTIYGEVPYINCDSIVTAAIDEVSRSAAHHVPCPPTRTIVQVDTFLKQQVIHIEDSAKLVALRAQLTTKTTEANKYKSSASTWRKSALITWGVLFLIVVGIVIRTYLKNKDKVISELAKMKGI